MSVLGITEGQVVGRLAEIDLSVENFRKIGSDVNLGACSA